MKVRGQKQVQNFYKNAIAVTQPDEPIVIEKTTDENSEFKRGEYDVKELALAEDIVTEPNMIKQATKGAIIFIHYHLGIDADMIKKNPHLYAASKREFREIHDESLRFLKKAKGLEDKVHIVKVKRNADSMIFVEPPKAISSLWNACLNLTALLPEGK